MANLQRWQSHRRLSVATLAAPCCCGSNLSTPKADIHTNQFSTNRKRTSQTVLRNTARNSTYLHDAFLFLIPQLWNIYRAFIHRPFLKTSLPDPRAPGHQLSWGHPFVLGGARTSVFLPGSLSLPSPSVHSSLHLCFAPGSMNASWYYCLASLVIRMDCSGVTTNSLGPLFTSGACPVGLFQADAWRGQCLLVPGCSVPPVNIAVWEPLPSAPRLRNARLLPALCRDSHPFGWWDWEH